MPRYQARKCGKKYRIYDSKFKCIVRERDNSILTFKTKGSAEKTIKDIIS
jgi:hypothetical protein